VPKNGEGVEKNFHLDANIKAPKHEKTVKIFLFKSAVKSTLNIAKRARYFILIV
jgi:hypothetical protein